MGVLMGISHSLQRDRNHKTVRLLSGANVLMGLFYVFFLMFFFSALPTVAAEPGRKTLTVVSDDNYPPYVFRDDHGKVQGILPDLWALWAEKTGIDVRLDAMDWARAQQVMGDGKADVIDTLFETEARQRLYQFSEPYATIDVPIFFHKSIAGIAGVFDLRGFAVGTKGGDACNDWLASHRISNLKPYPSYEALIDAGARGEIKVFCVDKPPGLYFLYKKNLETEFRYSDPLYSGQFHWAVRKGDAELFKLVSDGFAKITPQERTAIEQHWIGKSLQVSVDEQSRRVVLYGLLLFLGGGGLLLVWNWALRHQVTAKTDELQATLSALQVSQRHVNQMVAASPVGVFETDAQGNYLFVNDRWIAISGLPRYQAMGGGWSLALHPGDRPETIRRWRDAITRRQAFRWEYRFRRADGAVTWVLGLAVPQLTEQGDLTGYIGSVTDITERKLAEQDLSLSETKFRTIFDNVNDAIIIQDIETWKIMLVNRRMLEMYGYAEGDEVSLDVAMLSENIPPYSVAEARQWWMRALDGHPQIFPWRARRKNGDLFWVDVNMRRVTLGALGDRLMVVVRDVSERRDAETKLRESEESLRLALRMVDLTVFRQDQSLRYSWLVQPLQSTLPDMSVGRTDDDFLSRDDAQELAAIKRQVLLTGLPTRQEITIGSGTTQQHHMLALQPVRDGTGAISGLLGASLNITEHKAAQARMAFMTHHDSLTGLPNRILLRDRVGQAIAHAERSSGKVALLFIDLDHFKTINDSLGHPVGDALLRTVAARLQDCVRDSDTVSRQGGDEFLILLPDIRDAEAVVSVVSKILGQLVQPVRIEGHDLSITLSVGVTVYPDDGNDFDTLLKKADTAMYYAKQAGRNTYRFYAEKMNQGLTRHLEIVNGLHRALERGEFELFYQPQVSLADGRAHGVEALIRWHHPERGMVSPVEFIPVAEESGLIVPIGEWVLRQAARQAVKLHQAGYPDLVMAVNLSALQFRRGGLEDTIRQVLLETGLPPDKLELELTESLLIDDMDVVRQTLHSLKARGVRLSIDDFGTGYSSLSYLQKLEVDLLKIDQSFIRGLGNDQTAAIVRAIVQMARGLNLKTIAEGVETQPALDFLQELGCDSVQGYFFSRPLPVAALTDWLKNQPPRPSDA